MKLFAFTAVLFLSLTVSCFAESKDAEDPNKGLPKSGVLSSTTSAGFQSKQVAGPWNKDGASIDSTAPISGSVSRISDKKWKLKVFNNTEDTFETSVMVRQLNARGTSIKTDSYSFRLKAKESKEQEVAALVGAINSQLELVNWKRIAKPTPRDESSDSAAQRIPTPVPQIEPELEQIPAEDLLP